MSRLRFFGKLLQAECKILLSRIPQTLLLTLMILILAGIAAFAASSTQSSDEEAISIQLGVVLREEDPSSTAMFRMVTSAAGLSSMRFHFHMIEDEDTAINQVAKGELAASVIFPENFIEKAMYGGEIPVRIILPSQAGFESYMVNDLTETAVVMLADIQGACYAGHAAAQENGISYAYADDGTEVAESFLTVLFQRNRWYETETLSATGSLTQTQYYARTILLFILLLAGITYEPLFFWQKPSFRQKLAVQRIPFFLAPALPTFSILLISVLFAGILIGICQLIPSLSLSIRFTPGGMLSGLAALLSVSACISFLYTAVKNRAAVVISLFLGTSILTFVSGGLIPFIWLPDFFPKLAAYLPMLPWMQCIGSLFSGAMIPGALALTLFWAILFWSLSALLAYLPERAGGDLR